MTLIKGRVVVRGQRLGEQEPNLAQGPSFSRKCARQPRPSLYTHEEMPLVGNNTWGLAKNYWPCPPAHSCRIAEVEREYLLKPSGEIAIQRVSALIEAVPAARVEDQLLWFARARV